MPEDDRLFYVVRLRAYLGLMNHYRETGGRVRRGGNIQNIAIINSISDIGGNPHAVFSLLPAKSLHFLTRMCLLSSSGKGWQDVKFSCMNTGCGCGSAQFGQVITIAARYAFDYAKYMQAFYLT